MEKGKLKAAILGCGVISSAHYKAIKANSNKVELYAVCDIIEEKAIEAAQKYGAVKYYTDYKEMLKDENIDFVSICTPSGLHGEMAVECAKAGKHVLCEKPIDVTYEKLDMIVEAFENTNLKFGGVFQYRTYPGLLRAKRMLENGELGKVYIGDGYCKVYRSPEYYRSAGWRGTWKLDGGGCLMNQGIHTLDILCWLMGGAVSAQAKTFTLDREIEVEDTAFAILKFKNGGYGTFTGTTLAYPGIGVKVEIICEKGRIVFEGSNTYLYKVDDSGKEVKICLDTIETEDLNKMQNKEIENTANDPAALSSTGHTFLVSNLADAILENKETHVGLREARHAVDVILAIYESSKTAKEVFVKT
ncbi:MAG TPA: Gfo/Idh/MocA family oxidoreductase [Clostridiaceae bacterium]|nr:Gfo/Idh/MocA family oxidoreductase [Clostridiaceae bacterium]